MAGVFCEGCTPVTRVTPSPRYRGDYTPYTGSRVFSEGCTSVTVAIVLLYDRGAVHAYCLSGYVAGFSAWFNLCKILHRLQVCPLPLPPRQRFLYPAGDLFHFVPLGIALVYARSIHALCIMRLIQGVPLPLGDNSKALEGV